MEFIYLNVLNVTVFSIFVMVTHFKRLLLLSCLLLSDFVIFVLHTTLKMITDHMITKTSGQYDKEVIQRLRLENLGQLRQHGPHVRLYCTEDDAFYHLSAMIFRNTAYHESRVLFHVDGSHVESQ